MIYLHVEILLPFLSVFLEKEIHKRYHNRGVMKTHDPVSSVCRHVKGSSTFCSEPNPDEAESGLSPCTSCLYYSSEPFSFRPPTELPFFFFLFSLAQLIDLRYSANESFNPPTDYRNPGAASGSSSSLRCPSSGVLLGSVPGDLMFSCFFFCSPLRENGAKVAGTVQR